MWLHFGGEYGLDSDHHRYLSGHPSRNIQVENNNTNNNETCSYLDLTYLLFFYLKCVFAYMLGKQFGEFRKHISQAVVSLLRFHISIKRRSSCWCIHICSNEHA